MLCCYNPGRRPLQEEKMQRSKGGSVVLDPRIRTWSFLWWESGKRKSKRIGTLAEYPTKTQAWKAAKPLRDSLETEVKPGVGLLALIDRYRAERMPTRKDTRRSYETYLTNHIIPKWGSCELK